MAANASQITSLAIVYSIVIRALIKENIKAPRHWPLCGEFTGDRWIPRTKASDAENVSIWWRHHASWRHAMVTLSALLPLCYGNPRVGGGLPSQLGPIMFFFVVNLNKIKKNSWVSDLRRKTLMWLYCIGVLQGCHIVPHVYSSLNWITIGLDKGLYDIEPLSKPMMITHESQSKSQISTKIIEINQPLTKLYLIIRSSKGVYWFLSVHPSPASCVRSVAPTCLVGSISYLHILSSDFRRCVACKVSFKIWIFGNFLKCVTLTLSYFDLGSDVNH